MISVAAEDRISDESLPDQVARRLSNAILTGEYQPGARLPEPEIAARFGVSRGPVREAFHLLAREGLVQFRPRRGVVVAEMTPLQMRELYEVRAVLFAYACRLAARQGTPEMLAAARAKLGQLTMAVKAGSRPADFWAARVEIGAIISAAAGNGVLSEEMESLSRRALLHFAVFDREERRRESLALWTAIIEALEARDEERAAAAATAMIQASQREVLRLMEERQAAAGSD